MNKRHRKVSMKLGLKPGSVVYVGRERTEPVEIDIIDYSDTEHTAASNLTVKGAAGYKDGSTITWINVDGIHEPSIVKELGAEFDIHPLVLEDIVNTRHQPKLEDSEHYVFIVLKMLLGFDEKGELKKEQVSVLFGRQWVITFQEIGEDIFDSVRNRILRRVPRERFMSSDYLAYALLDAVVDHYFVLLEQIGEKIDIIDDEVSDNPNPNHLESIRKLKRQLIFMRKAVWPLREVIGGLERLETDLIKDSTTPYLRDLYEHVIQVIDTVETYRDMLSVLLDLYRTGIANRMNEIMKVLTILASIFIPLGFLAGVYGMNFDTGASSFNLPELGFRFGYPMFWAIAILIAGGLLWFFRRKNWL
jgi:magnesium transporter